LFAARDKDVTLALLENLGLPYVNVGAPGKTRLEKLVQLPQDLLRFYNVIRQFQPDVLVTSLSLHGTYGARLAHVPIVSFSDSEERGVVDAITLPLVSLRVIPKAYKKRLSGPQVSYRGNHELAYLHPARFSPDAGIVDQLNIDRKRGYVVVRLVSWKAFHDTGLETTARATWIRFVRGLSRYKDVVITSEANVPQELERYAYSLPPEQLHHVLAFADCYVGEGATTASEAVCLGTPAVYINPIRLGYIDEEERYGLLWQYDMLCDDNVGDVLNIACNRSLKSRLEGTWKKFIKASDDVSGVMVRILEKMEKGLT